MKRKLVTSFKLGLFTLAVAAALVIIAFTLGIRARSEETVPYYTYFDESVVGLDVGAPVKYRGLTIGVVERVAIAPDGKLVEVGIGIRTTQTRLVAWSPANDDGLRAQVSATGITGIKLVDLDYVDPKAHPPPDLPFAPPERYVPSAPSFLGSLQHTVAALGDALLSTIRRVETLVARFDDGRVPERVVAVLAAAQSAASDLRAAVRRVEAEHLPEKAASAIGRLDETLASIQNLASRIGGDGGVLSTTERAARSVDGLGHRAAGATEELERTLRDVGEAARAVRSLADAVERDPDMLLKGHAKARARGAPR